LLDHYLRLLQPAVEAFAVAPMDCLARVDWYVPVSAKAILFGHARGSQMKMAGKKFAGNGISQGIGWRHEPRIMFHAGITSAGE
jgi:hypothetical protein